MGELMAFEQWVLDYDWRRVAHGIQLAAQDELAQAADQARRARLSHKFVRRYIVNATPDEWDPDARNAPTGRRSAPRRQRQQRAVASADIGRTAAYRDAAVAGQLALEEAEAGGETFERF